MEKFITFLVLFTVLPLCYPSRHYPPITPSINLSSYKSGYPNGNWSGFILPIFHELHPNVQRQFQMLESYSVTSIRKIEQYRFFMEVSIGTTAYIVFLRLDTGSNFSWLWKGVYDPASSETYMPLGCHNPRCASIPNNGCSTVGLCHYGVQYVDQTSSEGDIFVDDFLFYASEYDDDPTIKARMAFGISSKNSPDSHDGIIGVSFDEGGLLSALSVEKFSVCFPKSLLESSIRFGEDARLSGSCTSLLLYRSKTMFFVDSIQVAGSTLSRLSNAKTGGAFIFDTGASLTHLHPVAMDGLKDLVKRNVRAMALVQGNEYELCYGASMKSTLYNLNVSFKLMGGASLKLEPLHLWMGSGEDICLAFVRSKTNRTIFGMKQMLGKNFGFDRTSMELCFRDNDCSF